MNAVVVIALLVVSASAANVPDMNQFCDVGTIAAFGGTNANNTAANQQTLMQLVVDGVIFGHVGTGPGLGINNLGLFNDATQSPFFTGAYNPGVATNYTQNCATAATCTNTAYIGQGATLGLRQKLMNFFGAALGCTQFVPSSYVPPNLKAIHQPMMITEALFQGFFGAVATTIESFLGAGVIGSGPTSYGAYLTAFFSVMRPNVPTWATFQVCQAANCGNGADFAYLVNSQTSAWVDIFQTQTGDATILRGGSVSWAFDERHNVIQTDSIASNTACTPSATCFNSAALVTPPNVNNRLIFTNAFPVAGVYTYRCARHAGMTGTITVVGSGAGALTASLSVMFAAIVAALALRQ